MLRKSGIPVIFFNVGDFFNIRTKRFVDISLRQASLASPDSDIILLTDQVRPFNFDITQIPIVDYLQGTIAFEKAYVHTSINDALYELTCFTRWFVIREFVRRHAIGRFCVFDSDIMLFSPVETFAAEFGSHSAGTWSWANSFSDAGALDLMCDYFSDVFADSELLDRMTEKIYRRIGKRQVNDMQLLFELSQQNSVFFDQSGFSAKGYDANISDSECDLYLMNGPIKYLTVGRNGIPLARRRHDDVAVPFHFLHFQGSTKWIMHRFAWTGPSGHGISQSGQPIRPTISRNEPCPCGSGRKFKHCHSPPQHNWSFETA